MNRIFTGALSILLFASCALAQSTGPTTGSGSTGSGSTGGRGSVPTPTNTAPTTRQPSPYDSMNSDPFGPSRNGVNGRIIPNTSTRMMVELFVDGARMDSAFTTTDGSFSFPRATPGRRYEVRIQLAEGTEFREEIDFQSGYPALVQINNQSHIFSTKDARKEKLGGGVISVANLSAPKKAVSEMEKGRDLGNKKKYDEGLLHLQKAVEIYSTYPEAYNEMGLIEKRQDHQPQAEEAFRKAIDADPKWTAPYLNLAQIQMNQSKYEDLLKSAHSVLQLDNSIAPAHFFASFAYFSTGKMDLAEKEALAAQDAFPPIPQVHLILANIYEARGNSSEAVIRYKLFLKNVPNASNAGKITEHIAKLEQK